MRKEAGPAVLGEQPGQCPAKDSSRIYNQSHHKSTLCGCDFTVRTILVLVAFAAYIAAICGAIVLIGYGVLCGIRAMSGIDAWTLRVIGLVVIAVIVSGVIALAVSED